MSKTARQYIGIVTAIISYYLIHEGAHFIYAVLIGAFRRINLIGLGVQVDVFRERMSDTQLGFFCLAGAFATLCAAYLLTALATNICNAESRLLRAVLYYITIAFFLIDPLYLSVLCGLFGGGDMNGIALLMPEWAARALFGTLLIINGIIFFKRILPIYGRSFKDTEEQG